MIYERQIHPTTHTHIPKAECLLLICGRDVYASLRVHISTTHYTQAHIHTCICICVAEVNMCPCDKETFSFL